MLDRDNLSLPLLFVTAHMEITVFEAVVAFTTRIQRALVVSSTIKKQNVSLNVQKTISEHERLQR